MVRGRRDLRPATELLRPGGAEVLVFCTGSARAPPAGFAALQPPFEILLDATPSACARLPTAHTCFNQIVLPTSYASAAQLREKLLLAVTEGGGGFTEM